MEGEEEKGGRRECYCKNGCCCYEGEGEEGNFEEEEEDVKPNMVNEANVEEEGGNDAGEEGDEGGEGGDEEEFFELAEAAVSVSDSSRSQTQTQDDQTQSQEEGNNNYSNNNPGLPGMFPPLSNPTTAIYTLPNGLQHVELYDPEVGGIIRTTEAEDTEVDSRRKEAALR